jgi:hypothetical protein
MNPANLFLRLLFYCGLLWLPACAVVPGPRGTDGLPLEPLAMIGHEGIFAASPDRTLIAYGDAGLQLLDLPSQQRRQLDRRTPLLLGWRQDGSQLAAVFAGEGEGRVLALLDRDGRLVEESELPGIPVALAWSQRHDLLVAGFTLRQFGFGSNLSQWLIRIHAAGREKLSLGDVTLKPATASTLKDRLTAFLAVGFSPAGDELVLARLHDPPRFAAYLQLVHRNWQVADERKLTHLPVQPLEITWGDDADTIAYRSASGVWRELPLWPVGETLSAEAAAVAALPALPGAGGRLQRFGDGAYLLAINGRLYRGSGLGLRTGEGANIWMLRKWRFDGLISPDEYREVRP